MLDRLNEFHVPYLAADAVGLGPEVVVLLGDLMQAT